MTFREGRRTARAWLRKPDAVEVADWAQHAKTALAGVIAWVVAIDVLGLDQPFLAPWAAVLVVHATVYRTVSRGGQQVVATFLGVVLAWATGSVVGVGPLGMGVLLAVAFLIGRHRWLEEESTTLATTGIVVLATNAIGQSHLLTGRLLDTAVGVVVGLAVNLVVWPPLRDRAARTYAHQLPRHLADTLQQLGAGLRQDLAPDDVEGWLAQCREVDVDIDHAWGLLRQAQESSRFNPRRSQPADLDEIVRVLHVLEEAVAETISLARTVGTSAKDENVWDDSFRSQVQLWLSRCGTALKTGDEAALIEVRESLGRFVREEADQGLTRSHWHEYGGVLVTLRNLVDLGLELAPWTRRAGSSQGRRPRYRLPRPVLRRDRARAADLLGRRLGADVRQPVAGRSDRPAA